MKYCLVFSLLLCAFFCNAANISLENWKMYGGKNCGTSYVENGRLIIKADTGKWVLRNNNRNQAVAGKAVKISLSVEILPPRNAMLTINFFGISGNKRADEPFHTMKVADTVMPVTRTYVQTANFPQGIDAFEVEFAGAGKVSFAISSIKWEIVDALPPVTDKVRGEYKPIPVRSSKRHSEKLDRGVTAFESGNGAYISWRLLKSDAKDIAFDVFRDGVKINKTPVCDTTDFYDKEQGKVYTVKPTCGNAVSGTAEFRKLPYGAISPCRIYRLDNARARVSKVGIGDLDGDGVYDYVVKYMPSHVDPWYTAYFAPEGTCKLEAVNGKTGKVMWKKDLGWSIETGVWYSPYIVYDFDCDGKAEVAVKTGEGDPRDPDGKVTSGKEYLTVFDGVTGKVVAQDSWPSRKDFLNLDIPYNFFSRNQMAVAYLDGKTPYLIVMRGTYSVMLVEAWQLAGGKLKNVWKYSSLGYPKAYQGQGAHTTRCCDIDNDGRDEIVLGNMALDDDGQPLWTNARRHPDFLYVADLLPQREGLESITCLEINHDTGGINVSCAKTGKEIWELKEPTFHVHYGFCGDIDPLYRGVVTGATDVGAGNKKYPAKAWIFTGDGKMLASGKNIQFFNNSPMFLYWDADLRREHLLGKIKKYNGGEVGGGYAGSFLTTADIDGDWREEVITSGEGEIRVYSTNIPAMDRRPSLMQDHFYRMAVATASCGYHYDPMPEILPSSASTDVVLTMLKNDVLQVTVTAPMKQAVKGKISLVLPENLEADFKEQDITLDKGGIWNRKIKLTGSGIGKQGKIYAHFKLENDKTLTARTLTGSQTLPPLRIKPVGFWRDAEDFKTQQGGKADVRRWYGVHKKCIVAWIKPGHKMNWQIKVPKDGKYKLIFRYATKRNNVYRTLVVNGKDYGKLRFLPTGEMGRSALDWTLYSPALTLDLKKGVQDIAMDCISGALSLDFISLVPVK